LKGRLGVCHLPPVFGAANKNSSLSWSFCLLLCDRATYLPVKVCFNIHKENNTVNKAIPIDATSAIIATFSSHENRLE